MLAEDIPPKTPGFPNGVKADNGYLGLPKGKFIGTPTPTSGATYSPYATYETRPLQINNRDAGGPNCPYNEQASPPDGNVGPTTSVPLNLPLGGFARSGDLLQVPFIGAYWIGYAPELVPGTFYGLQLNSVTMDSVYAQFQPPNYNIPLPKSYDSDNTLTASDGTPLPAFHNEQIGHFCPMSVGSTDFLDDPAESSDVFAKNVSGWTYHWAKRLFDYVDVRTPQDAYLPNVDPAVTPAGVSGDPTLVGSQVKYPPSTQPAAQPTPPAPVSADPNVTPVQPNGMYGYQQLQGRLDTAGTEGLININTANWKVLSAVPWYTPGEYPKTYLADNAALARAITAWRDYNDPANPAAPHTDYGPFRSIFDLMKVPQFATGAGNFNSFWVTFRQLPRRGHQPLRRPLPVHPGHVRSEPVGHCPRLLPQRDGPHRPRLRRREDPLPRPDARQQPDHHAIGLVHRLRPGPGLAGSRHDVADAGCHRPGGSVHGPLEGRAGA